MEKEFKSLSDERIDMKSAIRTVSHYMYPEQNIKEAVKLLKEVGKERLKHLHSDNYDLYCEDIDKIFGDKLIERKINMKKRNEYFITARHPGLGKRIIAYHSQVFNTKKEAQKQIKKLKKEGYENIKIKRKLT